MIRNGWVCWAALCLARAAAAELATARVIQVEGSEVVLAAGRRDGLVLEARVTLLRPGEPIVHPLTGQVLGTPQEPVGVARVFEAGAQQARGVLEKTYSSPQVGDLAEYEKAASAPASQEEPMPERQAAPLAENGDGKRNQAEGVMQRLKELEQSAEQYQASSKTLKAYPVFAQRVWDEISTMKSYLVSIDERLVQLEEQQSQSHLALSGGPGTEGMREFTIRYSPDTQVKLKVAGKTLLISVDRDSLRVMEEGKAASQEVAGGEMEGAPVAHSQESVPAAMIPEMAPDQEPQEEPPQVVEISDAEQKPWHESPWVLGSGVLVFGVVAGVISWLIKRRFEGGVEETEELETDDYLEEEEEEEA